MNDLFTVCSRMYALSQIPLFVVNREGNFLQSCPDGFQKLIRPKFITLVLEDFRLQQRKALYPLINYVNNGFFVGVIEIDPERYMIIGLVSPFRYGRKELMDMCKEVIAPEHLQQFCDLTLKAPIVSLPRLRAYVCLLTQLISGESIPEEQILFSDSASQIPYSTNKFGGAKFRQREEADAHAPLDYENGVCQAISLGRADLLMQAISAPVGGSVGAMSSDPLRQLQYSFISFATLVARAAIQGGLPRESAFLLSDLYCQRMDVLKTRPEIERLLMGMAMDLCDMVAKNRQSRQFSPVIRKALNYISVHLHDDFGIEDLSRHCGLCRRSLSMRFKEEVGMGVVDYIQTEKMSEACFLLEHTDLDLPQISAYLNYSSQSYFTQQFKKYNGETPERYRNNRKSH